MKKLIPLSDVERGIIEWFEKELSERKQCIDAVSSRILFEDVREDLIERARLRGDWEFVRMLHNPSANSRAVYALESYMITIYEEMQE